MIEAQTDMQKIYRLWKLDSVGAFISTDTGLVRPSNPDGTPYLDDATATHIHDVSEEWTAALDRKDSINAGRVAFSERVKARARRQEIG